MKEFNIYRSEKKVECIITLDDGTKFVGEAKCSPKDVFDVEVGKKIANLRATMRIRKAYKKNLDVVVRNAKEFLNDVAAERNRIKKNMLCIERDIKKLSGAKS